jgi:coproporphyrinogen III oxidase
MMDPYEHAGQRPADYFQDLQERICAALTQLDGQGSFREDRWTRPGGGGGRTRVLTRGAVLEKAGVSFSEVFGEMPDALAGQLPGEDEGRQFTATGLSLVLHPLSPLVPTVHANFRYLTRGRKWWFGGGADLTPYYPYREDIIHFHKVWKQVCERHGPPVDYRRFKKWCDDYFYLSHRAEPRGVGGIFFDYLDGNFPQLFAFVREAGEAFLDAYLPIAFRRKEEAYSPEQRAWQEFRRGRYVEFNLIYDRGTLFGLKTGGRTESILMSLPPVARWHYDYQPAAGSPEAKLYEVLQPRDWADLE